jgi:DNA polymerase III, gamma/tau subunits
MPRNQMGDEPKTINRSGDDFTMSRLVGQRNFISMLELYKQLPSFIILEGPKGQGKKTMANLMAKKFNLRMVTIGVKIDDIRQMIADTANLAHPTMYFIPDADNMSVGAKNSLLKITEEPPQNLVIVLSLQHSDNTLGTIRSRGTILQLDPYTPQELEEYLLVCKYPDVEVAESASIINIASNPGEVNELCSVGYDNIYEYADRIYSNILAISTGNSFKIANAIAFKEDDKGYTVDLLLKVFQKVCVNAMIADPHNKELCTINCGFMRDANNALRSLRVRGVNKKAVFDMWILNLRRAR